MYLRSTGSMGKVSIVTLLLGGVILWTFFDRSSRDISLTFIDELWNRNFVNLFSTPLKVSEYLTGVIIVAIIKLIISAVFMFLLATTLYQFDINRFGWFILPGAVGLILMGWSVSFIVQGFLLRFGHTVEVFIWAAAVLLQPFSCVFYPLTALPGWAQKISILLPSTYLFENMRSNLYSGSVNFSQILISFAINIIYFIMAVIFFYKSFHNAKIRGFLTREY